MEDDDVEIIMPLTINKYHGCIYLRKDQNSVKYTGEFRNKSNKRLNERFDSFDEGFDWIKLQNELEGNEKVKNIIYKRGEEYQCTLTQDVIMLFDEEDIRLVQSHIWYTNTGYACTKMIGLNGDSTTFRFHTMLIGYPPNGYVTDHKDRNRANNKNSNLRFVTIQTNALNKKTPKHNTSGMKGVTMNTAKSCWVTTWTDENKVKGHKRFSITELGDEEAKRQAIEYRKMIETTLPHYIEALQYEK